MTRTLCRLFASALLAALPLVPRTARAEEPVRVPGGVRAAVEVTALDLDVVATKDGKFVTDLKKEEFAVKVDGKSVPLDYFTPIEEGTLFAPDLSKASPDLILDSVRNDAGQRYLARQVLVFFDDEHLLPFDRPRAIEGLRELVYKLAPTDQVSLLRYNRGYTRTLVPFTGSKEEILNGLAALEKLPPGGLNWSQQAQQDYRTGQSTRYASSRTNVIRNYSQQAQIRERTALGDIRRAISALAARSGKRTMLYISSGIELRPGQGMAYALGFRNLQQFEYDVTKEYRDVLREANESNVTMYVVDARGLTTDVDAGESQPFEIAPYERDIYRKEALHGFAEETGGVLFENRNVFKGAMDQVYRETSSFYSIGVTLSNLPKKEQHAIKVSVSRPGVTVRTRSNFVPRTAEKANINRMELALLTPDAKGDFDVAVSVGLAQSAGIGRRQSPLEVRIPLSALTFKEAGGRQEAAVDITVAAVEDNGARSDVTTVRRTISLDPARWEKDKDRFYLFSTDAMSRPGNLRFVVSVKDMTTNRTGLGSANVRIE
ncbi:MAG TPA: VWA domain-containing protein [Thermoanaerobaculia bacterium]|nr:VWA domain-containing protein [Thermoanaerobaculia bacterium]HQR67146.1 VWA domain-containing protein [Thermoanaerobaculia bacterium]